MAERDAPGVLDTTAGEFPLREHLLRLEGRECSVLHVGAVLTDEDEIRAIVRKTNRLPYGVSLWARVIEKRMPAAA